MHLTLFRILNVLKKTAIALAIFSTVLILTAIILFLIYKNTLQQAIIREINKYLTADVRTGKINISLLAHFPMVSVKIKDIQIKDLQNRSHGKDLLQTDELSLQFNLIDLLHQEYNLRKVKISNARINLMIFEDGSDNFHIWKQSGAAEQSHFSIELREVILQMTEFTWQNLQTDDMYAFNTSKARLKGDFSNKRYHVHINGEFFISLIKNNNRVYLTDKNIMTDLSIDVNNQDLTYEFKEGMIRTGLLTLHLNGTVSSGPGSATDLLITSEAAPLSEYMDILRPFLSIPQNVAAEGDVTASMTIKGKPGGAILPDVRFGFEMDNGSFRFAVPDLNLDNVHVTGNYVIRSSEGDIIKDELIIVGLTASLGKGSIRGSVTISDLNRPYINLTADMSLMLQDLVELWPADSVPEITGQLNMGINLKGPLRTLHNVGLKDILACKIQGEMNLQADRLLFKNSVFNYHDIQADISFDNKHLNVHSLVVKLGESDFQMQGICLNFLPWLLTEDETLRIDVDLNSNLLNLDEILQHNPEKTGIAYHFPAPPKITLNLDIFLNELSFRNFSASDLKTNMTLHDQKITFHDLVFKSMEGNVSADGSLKLNNDGLCILTCNARLKHMNIRQLFHDLKNFGQINLTDDNLRGYMDAEMYYSSSFGSDLTIDPKSIYALGQLNVRSGELIGYTPLYRLSGFLNIEDLKHIRFSELNNLIEISHQTIIIPEMEIKSSTLDLNLYGTHTFSNEIDYHFSLLLSQLLSAKFKSRTQDEFGVVEDDGFGRTKLYISLTGTVDDPKIIYDRIALKEKLSKDVQKERIEIRKALQNEFRIREPNDSIHSKQYPEKIKGPKFRVKWEDNDSLPDPENK